MSLHIKGITINNGKLDLRELYHSIIPICTKPFPFEELLFNPVQQHSKRIMHYPSDTFISKLSLCVRYLFPGPKSLHHDIGTLCWLPSNMYTWSLKIVIRIYCWAGVGKACEGVSQRKAEFLQGVSSVSSGWDNWNPSSLVWLHTPISNHVP